MDFDEYTPMSGSADVASLSGQMCSVGGLRPADDDASGRAGDRRGVPDAASASGEHRPRFSTTGSTSTTHDAQRDIRPTPRPGGSRGFPSRVSAAGNVAVYLSLSLAQEWSALPASTVTVLSWAGRRSPGAERSWPLLLFRVSICRHQETLRPVRDPSPVPPAGTAPRWDATRSARDRALEQLRHRAQGPAGDLLGRSAHPGRSHLRPPPADTVRPSDRRRQVPPPAGPGGSGTSALVAIPLRYRTAAEWRRIRGGAALEGVA